MRQPRTLLPSARRAGFARTSGGCHCEPPRPCEAAKQSPSYSADFACQAGDCFASLAMTAMNGAIAAAENAASSGEESRVCKDVTRLSLRAAEALRGGEAIAVLSGGLCLPGRGLLRFARNDSDERGDCGRGERCFQRRGEPGLQGRHKVVIASQRRSNRRLIRRTLPARRGIASLRSQ